MIKVSKVEEIAPEPARCITVDHPRRLFAAGGSNGAGIVSHNSVSQRNIVITCILRANQPEERLNIALIDLKRVEMSSWRGYKGVVGVATELEDAVNLLRASRMIMMDRYDRMEKMGITDKKDLDLPGEKNPLGPTLIVMVDELGELIKPSGGKALSEYTLVATPGGFKALSSIEIGDTVYDENGLETTVTNKYEPPLQGKFSMRFKSVSRSVEKDFIAGAEHDWKVFYINPDGSRSDVFKVDSQTLFALKKAEDGKPIQQRRKIAVVRKGVEK